MSSSIAPARFCSSRTIGADLLQHAQAERQPGVDAGRLLADHAGAQHQPMRDDLRLFRRFLEDGQKIAGEAHGARLWTGDSGGAQGPAKAALWPHRRGKGKVSGSPFASRPIRSAGTPVVGPAPQASKRLPVEGTPRQPASEPSQRALSVAAASTESPRREAGARRGEDRRRREARECGSRATPSSARACGAGPPDRGRRSRGRASPRSRVRGRRRPPSLRA